MYISKNERPPVFSGVFLAAVFTDMLEGKDLGKVGIDVLFILNCTDICKGFYDEHD